MNILYITPAFPYPLDSGGKIRSFVLLQCLARQGSVTLLSMADAAPTFDELSTVKTYCSDVILLQRDKGSEATTVERNHTLHNLWQRIKSLQSWYVRDFYSPMLSSKLSETAMVEFDLIVVRYAVYAQYFFNQQRYAHLLSRLVVDVDDITVKKYQLILRDMPVGLKKIRRFFDFFLLHRYYQKLNGCLACFATSETDRNYVLKNRYAKNLFVVPNTYPFLRNGVPSPSSPSNEKILFCGSFSYEPNRQAVMFFANQIFPLIQKYIPSAVFTIIGKAPTPDVLELEKKSGINVVGPVADVSPYYEGTTLVVVPVLTGGGTRLKVLEAMAFKRPIVSTHFGVDGLTVESGVHVFISDDPGTFASYCVHLLRDRTIREKLTENAYKLVRERYSFNAAVEGIDHFFDFYRESRCSADENRTRSS